MYITFRNNSTGADMLVTLANQKHIIKPCNTVDLFCNGEKIVFTAETAALHELIDAVNEIDDKDKSAGLKDRILTKLTKKAFGKLPDTVLNTAVQYEVSGADACNTVIDLYDGAWAVCDGKVADFLDVVPVCSVFARAEASNGNIKVSDTQSLNRKQYLKLVRNVLLFQTAGLTSLNLLFFIPEYLIVKFFASAFYMKRMLTSLYAKSPAERENILNQKAQRMDSEAEKKGCLPAILKGLIVLSVFILLAVWAMTSPPDVVISEDFSTVVCFEETYIKTDERLPADAKDVFLEDYGAWYPLEDGGYDTESYYCYIYETPDGERWLWLKDNCTDAASKNKDYADYEKPLVYKLSPA